VPFGATADSEACAETADCSVRAEVCGLRICGRTSAVIIANWIRGLTANGLFRRRHVVLTMNSVKFLHAVRSAITATAELLVYCCLG